MTTLLRKIVQVGLYTLVVTAPAQWMKWFMFLSSDIDQPFEKPSDHAFSAETLILLSCT